MNDALEYRMLIGVDGSHGSDVALAYLAALPVRARDEVIVAAAPVVPFAVRAGYEGPFAGANARARDRARSVTELGVAHLVTRGIRARGLLAEGDDPVDALLRAAEREHASLIVVGARGRGRWATVLLGSTARALTITSRLPVLVVREPAAPPLRVIAATDGSPAARAALAAYARMPQVEGASLELMHVLPMYDWREGDDEEWAIRESLEHAEEDAAQSMLDAQRALAPRGLQVATHLARGHVAETIRERAKDMGAQLIVLGTRGHAGPRQPFFGSTAERVLTDVHCSVLVAPRP